MRALRAQDILEVWEWGRLQHPLDRALTILAAGWPEASRDELAALPMPQRDSRLLWLRELTFGSRLDGFACCPGCGERLEFTLDAAALRGPEAVAPQSEGAELLPSGFRVRFRLPNSLDLGTAVALGDAEGARHRLAERCVFEAWRDGEAIPPGELPDGALAELAARMAEHDPQAETTLDLECPACAHRWQAAFDIASFIWGEICGHAKRLLREVHALARAYGWREAEILSLSAARREMYLQMVS